MAINRYSRCWSGIAGTNMAEVLEDQLNIRSRHKSYSHVDANRVQEREVWRGGLKPWRLPPGTRQPAGAGRPPANLIGFRTALAISRSSSASARRWATALPYVGVPARRLSCLPVPTRPWAARCALVGPCSISSPDGDGVLQRPCCQRHRSLQPPGRGIFEPYIALRNQGEGCAVGDRS